MNGLWDILSVAIGVSFVFMILSILNSWIQDYIAAIFKIRANNLADIMQVLLEPRALKLNGKVKARERPMEHEEGDSKQTRRTSNHRVEAYETLRSIAKNYEVSIADLQNANLKVLDEMLLPQDEQIQIPEYTYPVAPGDTLKRIEEKLSLPNDLWILVKDQVSFDQSPEDVFRLRIPGFSYLLMANEKLEDIAAKFGVPVEELRTANPNISIHKPEPSQDEAPNAPASQSEPGDSDTLGQRIVDTIGSFRRVDVPLDAILSKGSQLEIPEIVHQVRPDDTLKKIADAHNISVDFMPLLVETLRIPGHTLNLENREPLNAIGETYKCPIDQLRNTNLDLLHMLPLPVGARLKIPGQKVGYTVKPGDTMFDIAAKFGVSFEDLDKANRLVSFGPKEELPVGITLEIPRPEMGQMESRRNVLEQLIANPVGSLYSHPTINSLSRPGELPDRIPTKDFTVALLDLLDDIGRGSAGKESADVIDMQKIIQGIHNLENAGHSGKAHPLAFRLRSLLHTAQINTQINRHKDKLDASLEEFQKAVSAWFDDTVSRGSVWYKQKMQRLGILFGILLAILLNADTIGIANALWHNAVLRESISQAAEASVQQGQAPDSDQAQAQLDELLQLGLPIGWSFEPNPDDPRAFPTTTGGWVTKSIGLLLTGFAISQGSQLWFDLVNRLINIRSSVSKSDPEELPSTTGA